MKTLLSKLAIAVLVITGSAAQSLAQSSYFVKIDGIKGESSDIRHKDEIEVFSFNLGVKQADLSNSGGGAGAGKPQFLPVMIYKNVDMASPPLFLACATGQHIKKVELTAAKSINESPQDYFIVTLTDVVVSGFNDQSADASGVPTVLETVSLTYGTIEISYRKTNPDGSLGVPVKAGYDVKANKKL